MEQAENILRVARSALDRLDEQIEVLSWNNNTLHLATLSERKTLRQAFDVIDAIGCAQAERSRPMSANVLTWYWHLVLDSWIWLPIGLSVVFRTTSLVLMVLARTLLFFSGVDPNTVVNPGERDIKIWNKRHPESPFHGEVWRNGKKIEY